MKKNNEKLKAIEAFVVSKKENADKALEFLGDSTDPSVVRKKLAILLNANRPKNAADFLKTINPHELWCELGLRASLEAEEDYFAKQLFAWIKENVDDEILLYKCRNIYAAYLFNRIYYRRKANVINPGSLSKDETTIMYECLEYLKPIIAKVLAEGKVFNEIESESLQIAIRIHYLLQDNESVQKLAIPLLKREPLPLEAARMAMRRIITDQTIVSSIPEKLRIEYPLNLEARLIAAMIETEVLSQPELAYKHLKKINYFDLDEPNKLYFCGVLTQISQYLDLEKAGEVYDLCEHILGPENKYTIYAKVDVLFKEKNYPNAEKMLLSIKDDSDPIWLQMYARYLSGIEQIPEALDCLEKSWSILPHPEILKTAAHLAFNIENFDKSVEILEKALPDNPNDYSVLNNLANINLKRADYVSAAKYYQRLRELRPNEPAYLMNLAVCFTQMGDTKKAIEVYDEIIASENPPLSAYIAKAYLQNIDDPKIAFSTILPLKDKYWDDPQYLQAVLDLAFKSDNEEHGHQALIKLRQLQNEGKAPEGILQAKTLEDFKEHAKHWNEKVKLVNDHLIHGKFPWTLADCFQNHALYMGWYVRTQPIDWYVEEPLVRSAHCIYATNCFTVYEQPDKTSQLEYIKCPSEKPDLVVDISALVTMHQLGLFEHLKKYAKHLYISTEYISILLQDSQQLGVHQLSRKLSAQEIENEIKLGRIQILDDSGNVGKRPMPFVNEHTMPENEDEHYYRLIDMINVAYDSGKLDEKHYSKLKQVAHKETGCDLEHASLHKNMPILVDLLTLYTIFQVDPKVPSVQPLLETFQIYISKQDQLRNSNDLFRISKQEEIKSWNDDLLKVIRDDDLFIKQSHRKRGDEDDDYIASVVLASQKNVPLLTDDRVLQVLAINGNKSVEFPAFGMDRMLLKLFEEKIIDMQELSEAYKKMMEWRYRFIVPNHHILFSYLLNYKSNPPGDALKRVALYLHDCMRDPGLFGGIEKTTRNESMAIKFLLSWIHEVSYFLADVWEHPEFDETSSKTITEWTVNHFIPSLPKYTGERGIAVADKIEESFLLQYSTAMFLSEKSDVTAEGFHFLADCLRLDEDTYHKYVCELIDG